MKKIVIGLASVLLTLSAWSQNNPQIQNKKGTDIMPVQGDFAIGVNAIPVLTYVGDIFGLTSQNNALAGNKFVSSLAANTLFGKYMLFDNQAIRAHLRIGFDNNIFRNEVDDNGQDDASFMVTDVFKYNAAVYNIGAGYEWRRGKNRLRGIYGGEVFYRHVSGGKQEYTYGNPIQDGNETPHTTFWTVPFGTPTISTASSRTLSVEGGNFNGFGLRAFAGIEYFFAPKVCVGTEFGWGGMYGTTGATTTTQEYWDFADDMLKQRTVNNSGSQSISVDTDNFNGALYLMFYF